MHENCSCDHYATLRYCKECDAVYCEKCGKEWVGVVAECGCGCEECVQ